MFVAHPYLRLLIGLVAVVRRAAGSVPDGRRDDLDAALWMQAQELDGMPLGYVFQQAAVFCVQALDSNDSEAVDIADTIYVLATLFAMGPEPSAPFPDCGNDPTPGALTCDSSACP